MARFPTVGGDQGSWGDVITQWADVSHNNDGTLKPGALTTAGALLAGDNLSDVANAATARTNLGLGTAATHASTDFTPTAKPWLVVSGQHVYEGVGGPRYRTTGYDAFTWNQIWDGGTPSAFTMSAAQQEAFVKQCRPNSLFRIWAHDPLNGYNRTQALGYMDAIVNLMTQYGHRVLFMLTNYNGGGNDRHQGPGGGAKTATWFSAAAPWYTAAGYVTNAGGGAGNSFEEWARLVATHYASNPTVAGYDLMNEIQDTGGTYTSDIHTFASYMSNVIKTANPNALVYMGTQYPSAVGGDTQYQTINAALDFCSCHEYTSTGFPQKAVLAAQDAIALNKPLLIDEVGIWAKAQYGYYNDGNSDTNNFPAVPWDIQAKMMSDYIDSAFAIDCVMGTLWWEAKDTDEGSTITVASVTLNGTTTATVASGGFPSIISKMPIVGDYITPGTVVQGISGNTLTLSQAATGSGTVTLVFYSGYYTGAGSHLPIDQAPGRYVIRDRELTGSDFNYLTVDSLNGWIDANFSVRFPPETALEGPNSGATAMNWIWDRWNGSSAVQVRQATVGLGPITKQGKVPGKFPSLYFDGTRKFNASGWTMGNASASLNQQNSFVAVVCPTALPAQGLAFLLSSTSGNGPTLAIDSSGYLHLLRYGGNSIPIVVDTSSVALTLNTLHLIEVDWDAFASGLSGTPGSYQMYIDGVLCASGTKTQQMFAVTPVIGGSSRTDSTCSAVNGSPVVNSTTIHSTDLGSTVTGLTTATSPVYVGTVINATSYRLSSSPTSQVDVNFTGTTGAVTSTYVGQGYQGHIVELMHFDSYLTDAERARIYGYLNWRYGSFPNATPLVNSSALPVVGAGGGPVGDGTHVAQVTYDQYGRVTAVTPVLITAAAPAVSAFAPAAPAATVSTTLVMAGIGSTVAFTPAVTGKLMVRISGTATQATAATLMQIVGRYGTGAAPNNGDPFTGTAFPQGILSLKAVSVTSCSVFFEAILVVSGLTLATAYWFDLAFNTANAADAVTLQNLIAIIQEVN